MIMHFCTCYQKRVFLVLFCIFCVLFCFGVLPSAAQGLLLVLKSAILPGILQEPVGCQRSKPGPDMCNAKVLPPVLSLQLAF